MQYGNFGLTNEKVSVLGFGCMRFPMSTIHGRNVVDEEKTIEMLQKAYEMGINYFDTAYFYGEGMSETVLGEALEGIRKEVYISTKCHESYVKNPGDLRRILERQLVKLRTRYIDFYHLHGIRYESFLETDQKAQWVRDLTHAKEEGLIRHISFSVHDSPENALKIIDTGIFETMLCQYNLIERQNEIVMSHASEKGLGVAVMGPLGGGRIPEFPQALPAKVRSNVEAAFRFVFSNPYVNCILSGMEDIRMLEENVAIASDMHPLTEKEVKEINQLILQKEKLADLYCTGCSYCMPCPRGIPIAKVFRIANYYRVYKLEEYAVKQYAGIGKGFFKDESTADACMECGLCEKKCPQQIQIRRQLRETHQMLQDKNNKRKDTALL